MIRKLPFSVEFIATGFYTGYSPYAPGTVGSLAASLFYAQMENFFPYSFRIFLVFFLFIGFFLGVWSSSLYAEIVDREDPPEVVIDEWIGQMIGFLLVPFEPIYVLWGFLFFRIFDILKPPPIRSVERFPKGWGIMLDDAIAGGYTAILLYLLHTFFYA